MVLIEQISYKIGGVIGDIILITILPVYGFTGVKFAGKFCDLATTNGGKIALSVSNFATSHSISKCGASFITNNVFNCLEFIE
jgi:hypothetical protein